MEQAVIVEGGVLTGEKIKIKNKTENNPHQNYSSSSSETAQENSAASSSTHQYVPSSKRRHSAGKT